MTHAGVAAMNGFVIRHAERKVYAADDRFRFTAMDSGFERVSEVERPRQAGVVGRGPSRIFGGGLAVLSAARRKS